MHILFTCTSKRVEKIALVDLAIGRYTVRFCMRRICLRDDFQRLCIYCDSNQNEV
jgi:hypothetical protein